MTSNRSRMFRCIGLAGTTLMTALVIAACGSPSSTTTSHAAQSSSTTSTAPPTTTTTTSPPSHGVDGTADLTDDEGYTTTVRYTFRFGQPTPDITKDPPGKGTILIKVLSGAFLLTNTTSGRDAPNDSYEAALFGLYQANRPLCTNAAASGSGAALVGTLTLLSPVAGTYCVVWFTSNEDVSDAGVASGQSVSNDFAAVQSGGDAALGYPRNDVLIDLDQSALASTAADLQEGPNFWAFGITNQTATPNQCSISVGSIVVTTYALIGAQSEPGNQTTNLTCSQ